MINNQSLRVNSRIIRQLLYTVQGHHRPSDVLMIARYSRILYRLHRSEFDQSCHALTASAFYSEMDLKMDIASNSSHARNISIEMW